MPQFFFNISSPSTFIRDEIGVEFADLDQVKTEAIKGAREILAADLRAGRELDHQRFEVMDEAGDAVLILPFRDVLNLVDDSEIARETEQ